jgi:hypothetical protein
MQKLFVFALCALAPLAFAADREIPYKDLHKVFSRVAGIPEGTYFRMTARMASNDPAVATDAIRLVIRSRNGDIAVPVAADGSAQFPVRDALLEENPPVVTNVAEGKLQVRISVRVEAPPEQRFRYGLMAAMQDEADAILAKQGFLVRMMAPDFEGLRVSFAPGTAATATVEAAKPETFAADAEGRIHIPDRKAWRKENPFVQLSAMPLGIALDAD